MSIAAGVTNLGRLQAEALMTATGTIERVTGTIEDPDTYETVNTTDVIYDGKCRLRITKSVQGAPGSIPGAVAIKDELILSIPVDAPGSGDVRPNDLWMCATNPTDPSIVGLVLRITGVHHGTYMTARRFPVEEVH